MLPAIVGLAGVSIAVGAVGVDKVPSDSRHSSSHSQHVGETDGTEEEERSETAPKTEEDAGDEPESHQNLSQASGKTVGGVAATAPLAEGARRTGLNRHAESGLAEQLHAKTYAERVGGTVVDEGTSVFAPDGPEGVDKRIVTEAGERTIQSKHFGRPVGESILEEYKDVDVVAATNGFREGVNPEEYGTETLTSSDWPLRRKARLEGTRILRGIQRGIQRLTNGVRDLASRAARGAGRVADRILRVGKGVVGRLWYVTKVVMSYTLRLGKAAVSKFLRLPLGKQILIIVGIVTASHLLWRWCRDKENTESDMEASSE